MPKGTVLDLSAWQGNISIKAFKQMKEKDGINIVILRSSYTLQKAFELHEDSVFIHNVKTAHKAGLKIGVYHYSQAISETEAIKEAKFTLKTIKPVRDLITYRMVAFDWEFGGRLNSYVARKLGKRRCKQICDAFCKTIQNSGFTPMVYANLSTLNGYISDDIHKSWFIWVAQYNSRCDYKYPFIWQYTSSGHVSGISGRVDMNIVYGQSAVSTPDNGKKYPYELPKLPHRGWFTSGDKGEEVKKLQRFLSWANNKYLTQDGECGSKTLEAVRNFQECEGLEVDGCFGKKSLARAKTTKRATS